MSVNSNAKKDVQLGMPHGTAANRFRNKILFSLLEKLGENICFQCGLKIESENDLSIEHKIPWLDNSPDLFWDINNIAFSHLSCNVGAAKNYQKANPKHGTRSRYRAGCRCDQCREKQNSWMREYNKRKREG